MIRDVTIEDVFEIDGIQKMQDIFSEATGVASLITLPDGTPYTKPSKFYKLFTNIILGTENGLKNSMSSSIELGEQSFLRPTIRTCHCEGLLEAVVCINVNEIHVANWLIGQVRDEDVSDEVLMDYAVQIGADKDDFKEALKEIPSMSRDRFGMIANMLFEFVSVFSDRVYYNYLLKQLIEDYRKKDDELASERSSLQALMDTFTDLIYFKDRKSRFIRVSKSHWEYFGLKSESEILGKTDFDFFSDEHALQAYEDEQNIIKTKQPISKEEKETWADRPDAWKSTVKLPLYDKDGRVIGTFGISRDITQRKNNELIIKKQNDELLDLVSQKDKLFSIIAHDLRSPFNTFMGMTEWLDQEFSNMSPDQVRLIISDLKNSANKIYNLLSNLLEWSKVQRGLIKMTPQCFLLNDLVNQSIEALSGMALNKKIGIIDNIADDYEMTADPNMIQVIFHNLLTNAIKFTPKGGEVIINARYLNQYESEISVSDSGIGIDKRMIDKLFRIDSDVGRSGTQGEVSSGLGLVLCKEFVEEHKGKIWVESEPGKGSTFYFTITNCKEYQ